MNDETSTNQKLSANKMWYAAIIISLILTFIIWVGGSFLKHFTDTFLPRLDTWWYPWQLPTRNSFAMIVVWGLYLAHQVSVWFLIRWAQRNLIEEKNHPTNNLTKYNFAMFGVTILFSALHFIQTQLWFDGLAKDVPIITSQGSVIIMLAIILVIENPRRGLIFSKRAGKPFTSQVSAWFRHNHMYIIAWALVYTFWFHPMANDPQLLTGFFYMFLLFTQMSLAYTWVHIEKKWVIALESFVAIHGAIVAFYNTQYFGSTNMWPMFLSGFMFMFVFTYVYALKAPKWVYALLTISYIIFLGWMYTPTPYGYGRSLTNLTRLEMLWIPIILYSLAVVFAAILYLLKRGKPVN